MCHPGMAFRRCDSTLRALTAAFRYEFCAPVQIGVFVKLQACVGDFPSANVNEPRLTRSHTSAWPLVHSTRVLTSLIAASTSACHSQLPALWLVAGAALGVVLALTGASMPRSWRVRGSNAAMAARRAAVVRMDYTLAATTGMQGHRSHPSAHPVPQAQPGVGCSYWPPLQ